MYTDLFHEWPSAIWILFPDLLTDILCKKAECHIKLVSREWRQASSRFKTNTFSNYTFFSVFLWLSSCFHVIGICLPSQSAFEKHNQEKKSTNLCAPRDFSNKCVRHV